MRNCVLKNSLVILAAAILMVGGIFSDHARAAAEEIVVRFEVPRLIQKDISALYSQDRLYLPIVEVFALLDITVHVDSQHTVFAGEYLSKGNGFEINTVKGKGQCGGREITLDTTASIWAPTDYYIRYDLFDSLFQLPVYFDFSELRVYLPLNKDFPAYQALARKMAHQELLAAETAQKDIASITRKKTTLGGGVADWALTASPIGGGDHYGNIGLGGMILGGDLSVRATANSKTGLQTDQLDYRWHYYFENNKYISRAELGTVNTSGLI